MCTTDRQFCYKSGLTQYWFFNFILSFKKFLSMEKIVTTTSFSQANVLQAKMKEEKLSHGETVKANISPVRLDMDHGAVVMYFCPMKTLEVLEIVAKGDGDVIPMQVKVEGLNVPSDFSSGLYG